MFYRPCEIICWAAHDADRDHAWAINHVNSVSRSISGLWQQVFIAFTVVGTLQKPMTEP